MYERRRELNFISFEHPAKITMNYFSSLSSNPLFSSIVTLYTLILLYFPTFLFRIVFSPIVICTGILLLTLLRLGAIQRSEKEKEFNSSEQASASPPLLQRQKIEESFDVDVKFISCETTVELAKDVDFRVGYGQDPFYVDSFVEWNVRAPLEAIYEEYEGEEEEDDDVFDKKKETQLMGIERYASLSLYYPETDSDRSSDCDFPVIEDWDAPESLSLICDEEDREGLIEIALDGKRNNEVAFHVEEENLIEIDISPARKDNFPGERW